MYGIRAVSSRSLTILKTSNSLIIMAVYDAAPSVYNVAGQSNWISMKRTMKYAGLVLVSLFFLIGGQAHFTKTAFFVSIVPPYVPLPLLTVYVTGVLELIGAVAIWVPRLRSWAGIGLVALTVCVTPANIYMWLNPQLFRDISPAFLAWRLVAQVVLLAIIWWSTRPETSPRSPEGELA
jgi:uncharacterized membrane protein